MKHVSVIIAAYNEERHLDACLTSLIEQSYPSLEIIVGNDGSIDKTKAIAKQQGVKVLEFSHQGTAIVRNSCAKAAKGEILCFLDADMDFKKDFIEKLINPIINGKTKGTFSKFEYVKNWDKPFARCWNRNNKPPLPDKLRVPQNTDVGEDFRAILKSEFIRVGGFDNTGYTDTWSLARKLGYKPINAPGAVYYHNNPETFSEVFSAASWIGKRKYKGGLAGVAFALLRANIIFSLLKGIVCVVKYREPLFLPFQVAYDAGISNGIISHILTGEVKK